MPALPTPTPAVDDPWYAVLQEGWTVRPPRLTAGAPDPADVAAAFDVVVRCESGLAEAGETTPDEIAATLSGPHADPDGCRLVRDPHGRAVALTLLEVDREGRTVFVDAFADPAPPGAPDDLLLAGVRSGLARAREVSASHGGRWRIEAGSYGGDTRYHAALERAGLRRVRHFHRMRVDFADHPAPEPVPPPGATLEVAASDEQRRALHAVLGHSFSAHWGFTPHSYEDWSAYLSGLPGADPTRWWLARMDGVPAAGCVCDDSRRDAGDGYVRLLGVHAPYRGRGVGRWLLQVAMRDAAARGRRGVQLGVDSENETGATALYESVGMRATRSMVAWQLPDA